MPIMALTIGVRNPMEESYWAAATRLNGRLDTLKLYDEFKTHDSILRDSMVSVL